MTTLRIGDFARLGGVSMRTLRHNHDLGLLLPANIDLDTGYRFYRSDQLVSCQVDPLRNSAGEFPT